MPQVYNICYWLIVAYCAVLAIHYFGVIQFALFADINARALWMVVPAASLLWMTRFIFGDPLDWDKKDKTGWKEGRKNYGNKGNSDSIRKKTGR